MKNLSVGKKLGFGYGIVIVLLAVILVMTIITSLQREEKLVHIALITDLQTEANQLLDGVNEARIELRTFFTSNEYTDEYDKAVAFLQAARARIDTMDAQVEEMAGEEAANFAAANTALRAGFDALMPTLEAIDANDAALGQSIAVMEGASAEMAEASIALVENVRQFLGAEREVLAGYIDTVTLPAVDLCEKINEFRLLGGAFCLTMDLSKTVQLEAMAEEIERDIAALKGFLQTEEGKAALQVVENSVATYREDTQRTVECYEDSDRLIGEARGELANLTAVVGEGVLTINDLVNDSVADLTAVSGAVMLLMIGVTVVAVAAAVGIALVLTRAFTRPLKKMQAVMRQAGEAGNLHFTEEVRQDVLKEAAAKDEIGQSLRVFAQFIDRVIYISECLERVAAKDLQVELELLGPEDTMGGALAVMLDNLNDIFAEINSVAAQVATASGEIAQGAQALAQGSTEQASTVEEIAAATAGITEQSRASSQKANEAARFSGDIRRTAEGGSAKMSEMIGAVQQINDASRDIGDVIKVIDDIAFQTNILALNAAVEAARAGEHGKGFAVVADEVRSLAGKSADAAKKTAELISANIDKAQAGTEMAQQTSESLRQIVEGIEETSASLEEIAEQSAANEQATAQVNLAIDQVAQVVQQNSATSEESAAASEEMSSQAQTLQMLVAQFRLRGAVRPAGLPAVQDAMGGRAPVEDGSAAVAIF